jgi:thiol-disulfide isomerase/thioredoxin
VEAGMMATKKTLPACAILISAAFLLSGCALPPSGLETALEVGKAAPPFKLSDLRGREFSLDQYKGKVVLLDFWATWCSPCRMTMPLLEKLRHEYHGGLVLLAINLQETEDVVRDYVRQQNLSSQVLLDEEGSVAEAYGAQSIPMQVLIDKNGSIRFVQLGFNPGMAAELRTEIEKLL